MKTCKTCGASKEPTEFYDRRLSCKACVRDKVREQYWATVDERRAYEARRTRTPERAAYLTAAARKHRAANPEKYRARSAVGNALRDGRLSRSGCEVCGGIAQAHHEDYSRPLDVRWLCKRHHDEEHRRTGT